MEKKAWDFPGCLVVEALSSSSGRAKIPHVTSLVALMVKTSVYNAGDPGSIPGLGRSAGEGNGNPLQYYCLENSMDRGAW